MSLMSIVPFILKVPKVLHKLNTSTVIAVQALLGEAGSWVAAWSGPDGFGENAPVLPSSCSECRMQGFMKLLWKQGRATL